MAYVIRTVMLVSFFPVDRLDKQRLFLPLPLSSIGVCVYLSLP